MARLGVFDARVLPEQPVLGMQQYVDAGGGRRPRRRPSARADGVIEHLLAAGLRGRGGAGFPTGRKWETVLATRVAGRSRRRSS